MPGPSRKTAQLTARMLELHAGGASAREIGEALKLNHHTIVKWLGDAGLEPNGGHGTRRDRRRPTPAGTAAALVDVQKALADLADAPAPTDHAGVLARLRKDFGLVSALVEFHIDGARKGTSSMAELDKAIAIQDRFASRLAELAPRDPPDPASDPANLEAAAEVRRRLAALVEAAERVFKCKACGRNPHGK